MADVDDGFIGLRVNPTRQFDLPVELPSDRTFKARRYGVHDEFVIEHDRRSLDGTVRVRCPDGVEAWFAAQDLEDVFGRDVTIALDALAAARASQAPCVLS